MSGHSEGFGLLSRRYLKALDYRIPDPRRFGNEFPGSGIGSVITPLINSAGLNCYRTAGSFTVQRMSNSVMRATRKRFVPTVGFVDGDAQALRLAVGDEVTAALASIPSRLELLEQVVERLRPQVSRLCVYLNGHDDVPEFLDGVEVAIGGEDKGDAGKLWWASRPGVKGYYLSCDDDIAYPEDYARTAVHALASVDEDSAVSASGLIFTQLPISSYHHTPHREIFHCRDQIDDFFRVHIGGTGVMAFHTDTMRPPWAIFEAPNMADIWISAYAAKHGISMYCYPHREDWIQGLHPTNPDTIWRHRSKLQHTMETAVVNAHDWPEL